MKRITRSFFPFLVLASITVVVFWPCSFAGFLNWDDMPYILNSPLLPLQYPGDVIRLFTQIDVLNGIYMPLTLLSFGMEQAVWGWDPAVFHLNNILLHAIAGGLVLVLGRRLGLSVKAAFVAALVFAIHPMRVESVAWVIEHKDLLCGIFYLGAMILYIDHVRSGRGRFYIAALVCAILSMLSKPMAVSLPLVLFLVERMAGRRWSLQSLWDKVPFMLTLWPIALISAMLVSDKVVWQFQEQVLIAVYASVHYVTEFFCPMGRALILMTPRPVVWENPVYMGALAGLLGLLIAGWFLRKNRWVMFAGGFYVLSGCIVWQIAKYSGPIAVDRYAYIPCVGFALLAGAAWEGLFFREEITSRTRLWGGWLSAAVLCLALGMSTFERCWAWQDSWTYWNEVIRGNPRDANAYIQRGAALLSDPLVRRKYVLSERGRYMLAHKDFEQAIRLAPKDEDAWHNLSVTLRYFGRKAESAAAAKKAARLGWHLP